MNCDFSVNTLQHRCITGFNYSYVVQTTGLAKAKCSFALSTAVLERQ
jgi:hypothetical protein